MHPWDLSQHRGPVAVTKFRQARQSGFRINGKTLAPSIINVGKFVVGVSSECRACNCFALTGSRGA